MKLRIDRVGRLEYFDVALERMPALDGLRGVAIVLVVILHGWPEIMPAGGYGVTVFFVLSGFLITGILTAEKDRAGELDLRRFFVKRALRLLPALVVFLAVYAVVIGEASHTWPVLGYVANWAKIGGYELGTLTHGWSLAVEEHFYVAWPLVVGLVSRRFRFAVTAGLLAVAVGWRIAMIGEPFVRVNNGTDTAAFALLAGCALAVAPKLTAPARWGYGSIAAIVGVSLLPIKQTDAFLWIELAVAGLAVVATAACVDGLRMMEWKPLRWVGVVSYGLYLWHKPLMLLSWGPWVGLAVALAATWLSWRYVEAPFLALKRRLGDSRQVEARPSDKITDARQVYAGYR